MKKTSYITEVLIALLLVCGLLFTINTQALTINEVSGVSMKPTLHNGDKVIVNKLDKVNRFDVVIFKKDETDNLVKRVIGMPGDHIQYDEDVLYINGEPYDEPYLQAAKEQVMSGTLTEDFTLQDYTGYEVIPENYYFVLGDNRRNSVDSRIIGLISKDKVIGTTKWVILPDNHISKIK